MANNGQNRNREEQDDTQKGVQGNYESSSSAQSNSNITDEEDTGTMGRDES